MNKKIKNITDDLEKQGFSIQEDFLSTTLVQQLKDTLAALRQHGEFKQAGVGREKQHHIEQSIRSDQIAWFDDIALSAAQEQYLQTMEILREAINQQFFLGLFDFEVHFALYSPNAFYKRHLDQHRFQDTRVLTVIVYLNENWQDSDGGQLRIYLPDSRSIDVIPRAGTLVCFFSNDYEHEVLPAKRERASLTGWFRKRAG